PVFTYLDVGCGPGSITIDFAQRFPRAFIVGVDPAESFIRAATSRAAELGVRNVLFLTGDGTFDVVSCHQVLSHLQPSRRPAALRNMHDLARKGGVGGGGGGGGGGGIVAAREAELEGLMSIHPETPLLSQWRALFYGVLRA
ncbi:S-adenosyl-L-methionine-dependent methyltransferase, partial [Microdochium trichocladiopsis]